MVNLYPTADMETRQRFSLTAREHVTRMFNIKNAIMQMPDQSSAKELVNLFVQTMASLKEIPGVDLTSSTRTDASSVSQSTGPISKPAPTPTPAIPTPAPASVSATQGGNDICFQPPRVTIRTAKNLNENVKSLREQLQNIHKLLNQTQDATEVTYEEMQDNIASRDISAMAVQQLKATVQMQNKQLT